MGKLKVVIIILCLSMFITTAKAQDTGGSIDIPPDLKFTHLSLEDGLSQTSVGNILQDNRGFMWFGTQDGLNRYDGYNFVVYRNDPANLNSLSDNKVLALIEAPSGALWIGTTTGGLNQFDPVSETFTRYRHDPNNPNSLKNNHVRSIWQDEVGILWLGTDDGWLTQFDPVSETFTHYQSTPDEPSGRTGGHIKAVYQDNTGTFWLGSQGNGLASFNRETGQFTHFQHNPDDVTTIGAGEVRKIYEDSVGNLWVSTSEGGLNLLDRDSGQFTHFRHDPDDPYSISDDSSYMIHQDRTGTYWVGTLRGLHQFDPNTGQFIRYQEDSTNPYALSDETILTLYEDRSGVLWFGTLGAGINKLDPRVMEFTHYKNLPDEANSLSTSYIYSIYEDEAGILWVGGDDGVLNRLDRTENQVTRYEPDADDLHALNESWSVSAIYEDSIGVFWVGTFTGGLHTFDRETEQFQRYLHNPDDPNSLSSDVILAIYEDSVGTLWIGTLEGGLNRFDRQTDQFHNYLPGSNDPNNLNPDTVRGIYEDQLGFLWLTSWDEGLTQFDPQTEQFKNFRHNLDDTQSLSSDAAFVVHEDQTGTLWIATTNGLDRFDRETETFHHYTTRSGLPNDVIYAIMEDNDGNLWVSTNKGVSRFDPRTETFQNYNVSDGLQSDEFNQNAFFQSEDGEMFFGGINGLNAFYPENITNNPYLPPVVLTDLQLFNQSVAISENGILQRPIWGTDSITLNYDQDVFTIEFAGLSYAAPERNRYRFRLEGFSDEWSEVSAERRFATYTSLSPGEYTFRVLASNEDGVWNEAGVSLSITILPPWWQTGWAYALYAIGVIGAVFGVVQWRVQRIGKQKQELEQKILVQKKQADERERLLTQIQQESKRVTGVINAAHAGVWLLDGENRVILSNPIGEKLLATLANAQVGDRILKVGDQPIEDILTSPPEGLWHEIVLANQYIELIARPIENGIETQNWVVVVRDVTRDHEMRKQVEDHDRLATIGQMAAGIAHDFNNILAVINMRASIIQRQLEAQPKLQDGLGVIHTQVYRATDLIEQILDFSRRSVMERKPLELGAFLKEVVKLLDRTMPENIQINVSYGADKYVVNADLTRIQQVIMNLVINASHALVDGGDITLGLEHISIDSMMARKTNLSMGKAIKFTVSDTGEGISPENINHLFDPFFTTKAPGKGTGLGLAQVHGIVNQHDGYIGVASKLGEGTTFTIYLPALITSSTISATLEDVQSIKQGGGQTILVVEDNSELRAVLVESLQDLNYKVVDVSNGFEAITTLLESDSEIELVLSDIVMPKMGGVAMFHAMQEQGISKPVIFMTGHLLVDQMNEILEELAIKNNISWLKKPLNIETLAQRISAVFAKL